MPLTVLVLSSSAGAIAVGSPAEPFTLSASVLVSVPVAASAVSASPLAAVSDFAPVAKRTGQCVQKPFAVTVILLGQNAPAFANSDQIGPGWGTGDTDIHHDQ